MAARTPSAALTNEESRSDARLADLDPSDDLDARAMGARLRETRTARAMSLRRVAAEAGISPSMLSQMETGKVRPSLRTLVAVSDILGTTLDHVIRGVQEDAVDGASSSSPELPCESAGESTRGGRSSFWWPSCDGVGVVLLRLSLEWRSTSSSDSEAARHAGWESGVVVRGRVELRLDKRLYALRAGDVFAFDATRPHLYTSVSPGDPSEVIWFLSGHGQLAARSTRRPSGCVVHMSDNADGHVCGGDVWQHNADLATSLSLLSSARGYGTEG